MLADELDYVVGVDTHRDEHALAIVDAHSGAVIAQTTTAASARGYADAVRFADQHALGDRLWAIEGAGHYGAGFVRHLQRSERQSIGLRPVRVEVAVRRSLSVELEQILREESPERFSLSWSARRSTHVHPPTL